MGVEEIQPKPPSKSSRIINNGRTDSTKLAQNGTISPNIAEGGKHIKRPNLADGIGGWHHSSRIVRVARATGGKDRHSKVWTSKGLRDRRVRLSVTTAIQFYDLQDRLGYDQPSKAVEWLIKAAEDAINELPCLNSSSFPDTPKQLAHGFDSAEVVEDQNFNQNHNRSASSSTSDTSKGSGLSVLKSDIRVNNRVKARERARERASKEKENHSSNMNSNPISQNPSFTELLTGGVSRPLIPMDYLGGRSLESSGFSVSQPMTSMSIPPFNFAGENPHHHQLQFPYVSDHLISVATAETPDYNLNFTISSGHSAGFNRGTLQSNSSSDSLLIPHIQRFSPSSPIDGSTNIPFFISTAASAAAPPPLQMENHHYHHLPPGLHLYGDGSSQSDHKSKGKNGCFP